MKRQFNRIIAIVSLLALAYGGIGGTVQAAELVNESETFNVPVDSAVQTQVCVRISGQMTCAPADAATPTTVSISAFLQEGTEFHVDEGAPESVAGGRNCGRLAKTVTVTLGTAGTLSVEANTTPSISVLVSGDQVPQTASHEICVDK